MNPKVNAWRNGRRIAACLAIGVLGVSCGSDDDSDSASTADTETVDTATPDATTGDTESTDAETSATAAPDSTEAPDSTSDSTGDPCADRDALRDSIQALVDVDVVADGTNGLTTAIEAVTDDLAAVRESAGDDIEPEVDAVRTALDDVQTAIGDDPTDDLEGTAEALSTLVSSTTDLFDALDAGPCAESAPTT